MQPQNFSAESARENILKKIETQELPPAQLAREMLRQGDTEVTKLKSTIEVLMGELEWEPGQESTIEQLKVILKELDAAHAGLRQELRTSNKQTATENKETDVLTVDEGWESPEEEFDLTISELAQGFLESGKHADRLKKILSTEEGFEDARYAISGAVDRILGSDDVPLDQMSRLSELAATDARVKSEVKTALAENLFYALGKRLADRLLEDPGYLESLREFQTLGKTKIGENGPRIMDQNNLRSLICAKEIFGTAESLTNIVKSLDLSTYTDELVLDESANGIVQILEMEIDEKTGDFKTKASAKMKFNNDEATIDRDFGVEDTTTENGETVRRKSANHAVFRLPEGMKSKGLAAKMFDRILPEYERMGVDEIKLHADIDVGGYAWASYGFDWDQEQMTLKEIGDDKDAYEAMSEAEKAETFLKAMESVLDDCRKRLVERYNDLGFDMSQPPLSVIVAKFDELISIPGIVTPQAIANFGRKDALTIYRDGDGGFLTAEERSRRIAAGDAKNEDFIPFHPGKVALLNSDWYGKMEGDLQFSAFRAKVKRSLEKQI